MFGGKVGGGFPDEVGDIAVGGQALQDGGIHVGAERRARGRGRPGRSRCRWARRSGCVPGRGPADRYIQVSRRTPVSFAPSMLMSAMAVTSSSGSIVLAVSVIRRLPCPGSGRRRVPGSVATAGSGVWAAGGSRPCPGLSRRGRPGRGLRSRGLRRGSSGSAVRPACRRRRGAGRPGRRSTGRAAESPPPRSG